MSVANTAAIQAKIQAGRGLNVSATSIASGSITGAAAASGSLTGPLMWLSTSTLHSTLNGFDDLFPAGYGTNRLISLVVSCNRAITTHLVRVYLVGTLNLATTSGEFTHDAATFPLLGNVMGQSSQSIALKPYIYVTTATTTTAPVMTMNYTNQDGGSVTGSTGLTFPSATTAAGSLYQLPLEPGDTGVRDISDIVISSAAATGAANIYLIDFFDYDNTQTTASLGLKNSIIKAPSMPALNPYPATSGTATSKLIFRGISQTATTTIYPTIKTYQE